ncbi:hypothetical protein D081_0896 [Anaerovibrio sp. JC8]|uniref:hypothetical protein n=1 Tax=Anaerovibrio sp. JC8 TaxID=1240085 RepID=UPI000A0DFEBC|nr:hypothetical protein [Anaerovibrio sp. JC8]ORU00373.1 hypothetical protein D081_0896 [Anaerovibrio sp. JC8]
MTTEILGFIIIVGAIIVFLARRQLQKAEDDPDVMEASAGRLRYELEQSADEIINRMAGHIDHLESLLREADYKTEILQQRIDELQKLQNNPVVQPVQSQQINHQTVSELNPVPDGLMAAQEPETKMDFSQMLEANMQNPNLSVPDHVEYTENLPQEPEASVEKLDISVDKPERLVDDSVDEPHQEAAPFQEEAEMDSSMPQEAQLALEAFREVSKNLEAAQNDMGLHIDVSSEPDGMPAMEPEEYVLEPKAEDNYEHEAEQYIEDPEIEGGDDATEIARKLLLAGYTPEEVGRFTGLGMNAIVLLKQIHKI